MTPTKDSHQPYVAFKSDKLRLLALVARDIRYVLIAAVGAIGIGGAGGLLRHFLF